MALPAKVDEFVFAGGLREHEDAWVQAQGFQELENCYEDKDGAIVKLPGYTETPTGSRTGLVSPPNGVDGAVRYVTRGQLVGAVCRGALWAKLDRWTPQGHCSPWVCEQTTVLDTEGVRRLDACRAGAWEFTVVEFLVGVRIQLRVAARATGETSLLSAAISDASFDCFYPRIVQWNSEDGAALLAYARDGSIRFRRLKVDSTGISVAAEDATTATLNSATTPLYDMHKDPAGTGFALIRHASGGNVIATVGTLGLSSIGVFTSQTMAVAPANVTAVSVWSEVASNRLVYAYAHHVAAAPFRHRIRAGVRALSLLATVVLAESTVWQRFADSGVPPAQADSVLTVSITSVGSTGWYITFYDPNPPTPLYGGEFTSGYVPTQRGLFYRNDGVVPGNTDVCGWVRMRSRPFYYDGRVYFLAELLINSTLSIVDDANRGYVLLGITPNISGAGRFAPFGFMGHLQAPRAVFYPPADDLPDHTRYMQPYQDAAGAWHVQAFEADAGTLRARVRDYALVDDDRVGSFAELGGQTYIAGALLSAWDGLRCLEAGVLRAPLMGVSQTAGTLAAGTRSYIVTFVRFSATGEQMRSFPSPTRTATNTSAQDNVVTVVPLCVTGTSNLDSIQWFIEVWRTTAGSAAPFYLVTRVQFQPDQRDYVTITDSVPDASLVINNGPTELPMTGAAGAELSNDPPLSPLHVCKWRNRLWLTDGVQIQYSKENAPQRAAEFSANFVLPNPFGRPLTALGPLGDVLMAFTEDATGYVYGDGPAANGDGSTLTGPVEVQTELGCTQPAGLVVVPNGLIVPTRRGIQRLDVKREYSFVGEAIEDTLAAYPRVRDVDYQLGEDLVWYALTDSAGTRGLFALLNLRTGSWSTAFRSSTAATVPTAIRHVGAGQFWGAADGSAYERTPDAYLLGTAEYAQRLTLPWFKASGLVGEMRWRRLWLLGKRADSDLPAQALKIQAYFDYQPAFDTEVTLSNTEIAGFDGAPDVMLARIAAPRQRCMSFRLSFIEDPGNGNNSAGYRFVAARFETAQRRPRGAVAKVAPTGFA